MAIVEIILYLLLAKAIYGENIKIEKTKTIYFTILVIVFFVIESVFKIPLAYTLMIISVVVFSEGTMTRRLLNCLTVLIIAMGIQEFIFALISDYSFEIFNVHLELSDGVYVVSMLSVAKLIQFLREKFIVCWKDVPIYIYINIILGFCAGIFPLDILKDMGEYVPYRINNLVMVISYSAILLNVLSIYLFIRNYQEKNKYGRESREKSALMKVQTQYLENTVKNYEYLRSFRHDMRGHLRILEAMCEDNPKALKYIENMGERINSSDVFKCGNQLVSAVLNTFANELNNEGIDHDIHYCVNGKIMMDDLELSSLLYNLTNNALEAERKADKTCKKIEVDIRGARNHLIILVINDVSDDFDMDNIERMETTKLDKEHHGIGLKNIYDIVDKYNGFIDYSYDDGRIKAELILQDVVRIVEN